MRACSRSSVTCTRVSVRKPTPGSCTWRDRMPPVSMRICSARRMVRFTFWTLVSSQRAACSWHWLPAACYSGKKLDLTSCHSAWLDALDLGDDAFELLLGAIFGAGDGDNCEPGALPALLVLDR